MALKLSPVVLVNVLTKQWQIVIIKGFDLNAQEIRSKWNLHEILEVVAKSRTQAFNIICCECLVSTVSGYIRHFDGLE